MKIYLAGPLFSLAEQSFNRELATSLRKLEPQFDVILPQERAQSLLGRPDSFALIFADCLDMVRQCDAVLAILDGEDADSGTCVELGYAHALQKPIVGVRTDFRGSEDRGLNLMVSQVCNVLIIEPHLAAEQLFARIAAAVANLRKDN